MFFKLIENDFPPSPLAPTRCETICSPVKSLGLVRKFIRSLFKAFVKIIAFFDHLPYLFVLYPSRCLAVHCINLLLTICLMLILLVFQLQLFSPTYQKFALLMLWYVFSDLKLSSALRISPSSSQLNMSPKAFITSAIMQYQEKSASSSPTKAPYSSD